MIFYPNFYWSIFFNQKFYFNFRKKNYKKIFHVDKPNKKLE